MSSLINHFKTCWKVYPKVPDLKSSEQYLSSYKMEDFYNTYENKDADTHIYTHTYAHMYIYVCVHVYG